MAQNSALHKAFCENVRRRRKELGLKQHDMAEALSISQGTYAGIETGRHAPLLTTVEAIATALDCNAHELLEIPVEAA